MDPCMLTDDLLFLGINTCVFVCKYSLFSLLTCRSSFPSTSFFSFDRYMYPCLNLGSLTQFSRNLFYLRLENVHKNRYVIRKSKMCLHPRKETQLLYFFLHRSSFIVIFTSKLDETNETKFDY